MTTDYTSQEDYVGHDEAVTPPVEDTPPVEEATPPAPPTFDEHGDAVGQPEQTGIERPQTGVLSNEAHAQALGLEQDETVESRALGLLQTIRSNGMTDILAREVDKLLHRQW